MIQRRLVRYQIESGKIIYVERESEVAYRVLPINEWLWAHDGHGHFALEIYNPSKPPRPFRVA
jgi:hypothetical protein